jgi:hypothetical protein
VLALVEGQRKVSFGEAWCSPIQRGQNLCGMMREVIER